MPLSPAISLALPGSGPPRKPLRLRYERRSRKGFCSRCCQLRCGSSGADHKTRPVRREGSAGGPERTAEAGERSLATLQDGRTRYIVVMVQPEFIVPGSSTVCVLLFGTSTKMIASWCFESARRLKQAAVRIVTRTPRILKRSVYRRRQLRLLIRRISATSFS